MKLVSIAQAKNNLCKFVNDVAQKGEKIILTSRGKPKAAIITIDELKRLESISYNERRRKFEILLNFRKSLKGRELGDSVKELRNLRFKR